jgi:hypothetical protein
MTISMYQASVPVFIRNMNNLVGILEKAAAHAEAKKIDPAVFLGLRLFPDMLPFTKQIQIASDSAKGGAARLAGMEPPVYEDNEKSFAELIARVQKTIDYLNTFKPEQIDGSEEKVVTIKGRDTTLTYRGQDFLLHRALPNLFFHITTAYAILRGNGVELGKKDFLGRS